MPNDPPEPPEPPGRTVTPDCAEIEKLIRLDPTGRSREEIFNAAKMSGGRTLRRWKQGGACYLNNLEALAKVLHGCANVDQLIINPPEALGVVDAGDPRYEYRQLLIDAMHTPKYLGEVRRKGGFDKIEVADFAYRHFRTEMGRLDISIPQQVVERWRLCRMGWLRGDDTDPSTPLFFQRPWNWQQVLTGFDVRVDVEIRAMQYAFSRHALSDDPEALAEYRQISKMQNETIAEMKRVNEGFADQPSEELATRLLELDARFHRGWAGTHPLHTTLLNHSIGHHLQPILRLWFVEKRLAVLKREGVPGAPTFESLVAEFYEEVNTIWGLFQNAVVGLVALEEVEEVLRQHVHGGHDYIANGEVLVGRLRETQERTDSEESPDDISPE